MTKLKNILATVVLLWTAFTFAVIGLAVIITRILVDLTTWLLRASWYTVFAPLAFSYELWQFTAGKDPDEPDILLSLDHWKLALSSCFTLAHAIFWPVWVAGLL